MRFINGILLVLFICLFICQLCCYAQSAKELEALIKKSKLVDTERPLRVVNVKNQVTISTYTHKDAPDRDCKITALFMLKEIIGTYSGINSITVDFFDPITASNYRQVRVDKKLASFIDQGKSVNSCQNLSQEW